MAKTIAQLRTEALQIKNATAEGENTALRVGGFCEDVVEYLNVNASAFVQYTPEVSILGKGTGIYNDAINNTEFSDGWRLRYVECKQGDEITLTISESVTKTVNYGYCSQLPEIGVAVSGVTTETGATITIYVTAPINGWFVWAVYGSNGGKVNYTISIGASIQDVVKGLQDESETLDYATDGNFATLSGLNISIMGNSICTFDGYIPSGYRTKYPSNDVEKVTDTWWWQVIATIKGQLSINNSYSAGRVTNTSPDGYPSYIDRYRNDGIGNPDIFFLWGGINDMRNGTTLGVLDFDKATSSLDESIFAEAYDKLVRLILADFPDLKIVAIVEPFLDVEYRQVIHDVATHYGFFGCIDLSELGNSIGRSDSLHPDASGMKFIANAILRRLTDTNVATEKTIALAEDNNITNALQGINNVERYDLIPPSNGQFTILGNVEYKANRPLVIEYGGYITPNRNDAGNYLYIRLQDAQQTTLDTIFVIGNDEVLPPFRLEYTPSQDGYINIWYDAKKGHNAWVKVYSPVVVVDEIEKKIPVVSVSSGATLSPTIGNYYNVTGAVGTMAVTLPSVTDTSHLANIILFATTGASVNLTFASADNSTIYYSDTYNIEASSTYEINAMYNGTAWVIMAQKVQ